MVDKICEYVKTRELPPFAKSWASPLARTFEALGNQKGCTGLDLGTGNGHLALLAMKSTGAARMFGIEIDPARVEEANRNAQRAGMDMKALAGDCFDGRDYPKEEVHFVLSIGTLHYKPREFHADFLRGIRSYLRERERVFVCEMAGSGNLRKVEAALRVGLLALGSDVTLEWEYFHPTVFEYQTLLEEAGFRVQSISLEPRSAAVDANFLAKFLNKGIVGDKKATVLTRAQEYASSSGDDCMINDEGVWMADFMRLTFKALVL